MLTRNGLQVCLMRVADGKEFPAIRRQELTLDPKDGNSLEQIAVGHGDAFAIRIQVLADFEWFESDILAVSVNYDRPSVENSAFRFLWIAKPAAKGNITIDLKMCPMWNEESETWTSYATEFCNEVV